MAFAATLFVGAIGSEGCSSSTPDTTATPEDAGTDRKTLPATDTGVPDAGPPVCPRAAPTVADLDKTGFHAPGPLQKVCTAAHIATFEANLKTATTFNDVTATLPADCASCIAGKQTAATWSFVVTDETGGKGFFNYGACYAVAPGGTPSCGKAIQYDQFCVSLSCRTCPSTAETTACRSDSATLAACAPVADIATGCGSDKVTLTALDASCSKGVDAIALLCGGAPPSDGGVADSSAD